MGAEEGVLASLWRFLVGLAPSSLSSTSLPLSGEAKMSGDHHMRTYARTRRQLLFSVASLSRLSFSNLRRLSDDHTTHTAVLTSCGGACRQT